MFFLFMVSVGEWAGSTMILGHTMALFCLVALMALAAAQDPNQFIDSVRKEAVAVGDPLTEALFGIGFSQCANVKKILGMSYDQMKGDREPDVNKLNVVYRTKSFTKVFNISRAPELLRQEKVFDSREKVIIYIHGFTDNPNKESFTQISDAFLASDEADHIALLALDCSALIQWLYLRSTTYVFFIGHKLAEMVMALFEIGLKHSQIHFVGHSLGSHISGFAGKQVIAVTGAKVGRITGLDPAGPCFANVEPMFRLNNTDAEYVDVIHTNAGVYGIKSAIGHADYFPNNGEQQPDCTFQTCSHGRPNGLFAESFLRKDAFPAIRCDGWSGFTKGNCSDEISYMGYPSKPGTHGLFYLQTAGKSPYGRGAAGIHYNNNVGIIRNLQEDMRNLPGFNQIPVFN